MFFILSKIFWLVASPLHFSLLCLGAGLFFIGRRSFGKPLAIAAAFALALMTFSPLGALLLRPLEDRFPPLTEIRTPPTGIIVLGGALDQQLSLARGQTALTDAAARLTEGAALARLYPKALLVFSGGSGALLDPSDREAEGVHKLWRELGVPESQMVFEDSSRNTYENALFTQALVHPGKAEDWLLITSAWHMPRSMGIFHALGMNPTAYPVNYRTYGSALDFRLPVDGPEAIRDVEIGLREWVGLVAYRLTGKTDSLFPGP